MMKSIGAMLQAVSGISGTLTGWERDFVRNCMETSKDGALTSHLSDKQVELVESIYSTYFE